LLKDLPLGGCSVLKKPDFEGAWVACSADGLVAASDGTLVGTDAVDG
jgi:hypothetical protein